MSRAEETLAFVGLLDRPDVQQVKNAAYSAAGALFQQRLLDSLAESGVDVSHVFALRPVVSFPAARRVWFGASAFLLAGRFPTTLLPFLNLGPLKPLSTGVALFPRLVAWAWRHRHHRERAILVFNVANPPGIASVAAARLTRTRVFAVVADIQVPGSGFLPDTFLRRLEFALQVRTLPRFDGLIVLTKRMADDFAPGTPHMQLDGAIPAGLAEWADAQAPDDADTAAERDACILMYAGGLSDLKGIPLLLDAFARLPGDQYQLWITGAGPLEHDVEAAAERDPRITFWGFPPYEEVLALYERATVLVNPHSSRFLSARYLFPSKLIEYLATGRPVISTCSTPEVGSEYGDVLYLLEHEEPAALAALIERVALLPASERRAMGARARAFVLKRKSWSAQGQRVTEFIRLVASEQATVCG